MTTPPPCTEPGVPAPGDNAVLPEPMTSTRTAMALRAAAFTRGPADLLEFVIPLWAGPALGASATATGLLVSTQLAVSVVSRPVAGHLDDRRERRTMAALGAMVYALSCVGYWVATVAQSLPLGYAAAVVGGVGGSVLWVSLRSLVSEQHQVDAAIFPKLAAEQTGTCLARVTAAPDGDPIDQSRMFWREVTDAAQVYGPLFFELSGHAMQGLPHADGLRDELIDAWLGPLTDLAVRAGIYPATARVGARLQLAVARGLLFDLLISGDRAGVDAAMEVFTSWSVGGRAAG